MKKRDPLKESMALLLFFAGVWALIQLVLYLLLPLLED